MVASPVMVDVARVAVGSIVTWWCSSIPFDRHLEGARRTRSIVTGGDRRTSA